MNYEYFYGPDKIPFDLAGGKSVAMDGNIPFHGIVSRGLVNAMTERKIDVAGWYRFGHLVFDDASASSEDAELINLRHIVKEVQALSFAQSADAANRFLKEMHSPLIDMNDTCELWNIKEGHTSSVWQTTITHNGERKDRFILNVARDREAGRELKRLSEKIQQIRIQFPEISIADVWDIGVVYIRQGKDDIPVVVTKNEMIEEAREIHWLKTRANTAGEYIRVDRFLTSEKHPSQISSILGSRFSAAESGSIQHLIHYFCNKVAPAFQTAIDINDGDLVWDGRKPVIVAIN